jgi:long-chain acyl-CoA synthetase
MATLTTLFESALRNRGNAVAMRHKQCGIWHEITWSALGARTAAIAEVLHGSAIQRHDRVAIVAENGPDWVAAELATLQVGAVVVGCYPMLTDDELERVLAKTSPSLIFVDDADQEYRIRRLAVSNVALVPFSRVKACTNASAGSVGRLDTSTADDIALITTTAGTSGPCTLVHLTHANLIAGAEALKARLGLGTEDETVSVLPLGHPAEQAMSVVMPMLAGSRTSFAESARTLGTDLAEVEPTVILAMPRLWQRLYLDLRMAIDNTGGWRGRLVRHAIPDWESDSKPITGPSQFFIGKPLRRRLGLARARVGLSIGARLPKRIATGFESLGIQLLDAYGGAEMGGVVALGMPGEPASALQGVELRADGTDRHVYVRGAQIPTDANVAGGWLETGDIGLVADNAVQAMARVHGRAQAADCTVAETELEMSSYVRHAIVTAAEGGLTAVVCLEPVTLGQWANKQKIKFTDFTSLVKTNEVVRLTEGIIGEVNAKRAAGTRVVQYAIYEERLSVERRELTPVFTLRYQRMYEWIGSNCSFTRLGA